MTDINEDFSSWLLRKVREVAAGEERLGPVQDRRVVLEGAVDLLEDMAGDEPAVNAERTLIHTRDPQMTFRSEIERRVSNLESEFGLNADGGSDETQYVENSVQGEHLPDGDGSTAASNGDREDPGLDIVENSTMGERAENEDSGSGDTDFVGNSSFMGE